MNDAVKPYVHLAINAVDTVIFDPEGRIQDERSDRFDDFEEARNAALSCVELMLDEADYDDEEHRAELVLMLGLLESAATIDELACRPEYRTFLKPLEPARRGAA
jgi:hypothetical protein